MTGIISTSKSGGKKRRKVLITIWIAAGAVALINLIWFVGVKSRYLALTENFDAPANEINNYVEDIGGYRYIVKDTGYLGNSGFANVSVAKDLEIEINDDGSFTPSGLTKVTLYIWPEWFSGYTYGVDIDNGLEDYQINVDKDGNYIAYGSEDRDMLENILEENSEEIGKLFDLADEMWDIR